MCCFVRNSIFLVESSLWKFQVNLWISLWAEANTCWLFESIYSWKVSSRELKFPENTAQTASLFKMAARQATKENLQCIPNMVIYVYRWLFVMYGWQILSASLPYMGIATICWIVMVNICLDANRSGKVNIYHSSPTLRWIIALIHTYFKTVGSLMHVS